MSPVDWEKRLVMTNETVGDINIFEFKSGVNRKCRYFEEIVLEIYCVTYFGS